MPLTLNQALSWMAITRITFEATIEVVFICLAGYTLVRLGLLDLNAQKTISKLNVDLFTPCLVFSKLAPLLLLRKLVEIAVIPIFYVVCTGIAYLCLRLLAQFFRLNPAELDFVLAMAVFGNSNSLPVSLTVTLAYSLPGLSWDDVEDDSPDKIASRGILYLLIFQQLGQVVRWLWGYNTLLRKRDPKELTACLSNCNGEEELLVRSRTSSYTEETAEVETPVHLPEQHTGVRRLLNSRPVRATLAFMNPPLYAMLASVVVASVPPIQQALYTEDLFLNKTLVSAIDELGMVSIPLILVILGLNLAPSSDVPPPLRHYSRILVALLLLRMILPLLVLLPAIAVVVKYLQISILDDPIFLLVAFILTILPPAIQLSQITQLNGIFQREMAGVLFWGYVVLTLPTTIAIVVSALEVLEWAMEGQMGHT